MRVGRERLRAASLLESGRRVVVHLADTRGARPDAVIVVVVVHGVRPARPCAGSAQERATVPHARAG